MEQGRQKPALRMSITKAVQGVVGVDLDVRFLFNIESGLGRIWVIKQMNAIFQVWTDCGEEKYFIKDWKPFLDEFLNIRPSRANPDWPL